MASTPSPEAVEFMRMLQASGSADAGSAPSRQTLGALKRMKYVEERDGIFRLTEKGAARLAEVANSPAPQPRQRRVLREFDPAKAAEWEQRRGETEARHDAQLAAAPADVTAALDQRAADDVFAIPVLTRMAEAVQADAPPAYHLHVDIGAARDLTETEVFSLFPHLRPIAAALREAGANVQVCGSARAEVRG